MDQLSGETLLDKGTSAVQKLCKPIRGLPHQRKYGRALNPVTNAAAALTALARLCFPPICL